MALSVATALEMLARLREAAPPKTAAGLAQVMVLIQSLSEENAFLSASFQDDAAMLKAAPAQPESLEADTPSPDVAARQPMPVAGDMTLDVMTGLNDALRAPLVAIRGRADLIEAGMLGQISEEQTQWLMAIQENTDRSFRVLDAIQRLINLKNNEVRIDWTNFITSELLAEAHDRIKDSAAAHKHTVTIQIPGYGAAGARRFLPDLDRAD